MPSYNKVILMGNLTRDPELKTISSGTSLCAFGLAVTTKYKGRDGMKEDKCFVDCTCFGKGGETIAQYVKKGMPLFVEGRLRLEQWEAQDGAKRSRHSIMVESFQFLGQPSERQAQPRQPQAEYVPPSDDIPF